MLYIQKQYNNLHNTNNNDNMIPYTEFLNSTGKIKTIMTKAYKCGLSAPTPNQSNQLLHLLKKSTFNKYMSKKLQYSSVSIDFKDFVFSYNYSHQFGDINFGSGGFHQITIGFNFLRGSIDCDCF